MNAKAIFALLLVLSVAPGQAVAACDWVVTPTIINNTNGGMYSTVNDLDSPWQDGIDAGHVTDPCGRIHYNTADQNNYGTIAGWPAGYGAGDYAFAKILVHDENGLIRIQEQAQIWHPATQSAALPATYQTLNGTHNYTIKAWVQFVDAVGVLDIAADANTSRRWDSFLNAETPTIAWNNPNDPDTENEIISASLEATDSTYGIFDVTGSVQLANNSDDFSDGCVAECLVSIGFTPGAGDTFTHTFDMENDGNVDWNANHPIDGAKYKACAYARSDPLQWSLITCENFTFSSTGGGGSPSANGTGILRGTVYENETGIPAGLTGVLVSVQSIGWATTTTAYGHFRFDDIPINNYTLTLEKSGYVTSNVPVEWDTSDNDTFTGLLILDEGATTDNLFIPLSDAEIQTRLRTYIPFLFSLGVGSFTWIVIMETFGVSPSRSTRRRKY